MEEKFVKQLKKLNQETARQGQALYVVGGTLRDRLLEIPVRDLDFTCADAPEWAAWFARRVHSKCIALDDTPGRETLRIPLNKAFYCDFSTLQGTVIEEDLAQRDFSINAMAQPLKQFLQGQEGVLDPFGGRADLKNRIIRALPGTPLADDPIRMLRAFRFSAQLDFAIESETLRSVSRNAGLLSRAAGERICHELLLFLDSPRPDVPAFVECGLADTLIQALPQGTRFDASGVSASWRRWQSWDGLENAPLTGKKKEIEHYLSRDQHRGLFHLALLLSPLNTEDATAAPPRKFRENSPPVRFLRHYKFSNQQMAFVDRALFFAARFQNHLARHPQGDWEESQLYRCVKHCKDELIASLLMMISAGPPPDLDAECWKRGIEALYDFYHQRFLPASDLPSLLSGNDLSRKFQLKPSPLYATILEHVEEARVLGRIRTREEAEALAHDLIRNSN